MINLLEKEVLADPYTTYNNMREKHPVCEIHPGGVWVISRYTDVIAALKKQSLYTSQKNVELFSPSWLKNECKSDLFIMTQDEKSYRSRRSFISKPFLKKSMMPFKMVMNEVAENAVKKIINKKNFDFLESFSYPYTMSILEKIIGLEELENLEDLHKWIAAVEKATIPELNDCEKRSIEAAILYQKNILINYIKKKQKEDNKNKTSFIADLVIREFKGEKLNSDQLVNIIELLIRTALQTTVHLLASAIIVLIERPNVRDELSNKQLIRNFVDELLRLHSSLPFAIRHATQDINLYNKVIPKDSLVLLSIVAANRDPRIFSCPDEYNLNRQDNEKHIAFGYGSHKCMGLHIARLEVEIALYHLLPIIERMSCPPSKNLRWIKTHLFRGLECLPITISN